MIRSSFAVVAIALAVSTGAFAQQLPPYPVQSGSMSPTAETGETLSIEPISGADAHSGDVVMYQWESGEGHQLWYIKRVVAIAGQRVAFHHGVMFVDGSEAPQVELGSRSADGHQWREFRETLGSRSYLVQLITDQPGRLRDMAEITVPAGHVFVVGDSRDNSRDSRTFGPIPQDNIAARATRIAQSPDANRIGRALE